MCQTALPGNAGAPAAKPAVCDLLRLPISHPHPFSVFGFTVCLSTTELAIQTLTPAYPFAPADDEALGAFQLVSRLEGIIPALETSHALAFLDKLAPAVPDGTRIVLNCSGRGDKDVTVSDLPTLKSD